MTGAAGGAARRLALDLTPLRRRPEYRRLMLGQALSGLGTQAALVALPYEIYVSSRSATLVGLLGLFELGPMVVVSLVGGAWLDRRDRRPILALAQLISIVLLLGLTALALGHPPAVALLVLGGLLAGASSLSSIAGAAISPRLLGPTYMRPGMALSYGTMTATGILGPGLGGLLIAPIGVAGVYALDAGSCLALVWAAWRLAPQPPEPLSAAPGQSAEHPPVRAAIAEGLGFVARTRALAGSFVIDINAMTFGMPRALFAVLALDVYHAGASGTGLLYASISVGGTLAVLSSGWVTGVRRLGRMVIWCVLGWGVAICGAGLVRSIWPAFALLALAGYADAISAVGRNTLAQLVTPERMRGRMSSVYSLVVAGGPRLGDLESGLVAGLVGALDSVLIGGAACLVGVGAVLLAFPELAAFDADRESPGDLP